MSFPLRATPHGLCPASPLPVGIYHLVAHVAQSSVEVGAADREAGAFGGAARHIVERLCGEGYDVAVAADGVEACLGDVFPVDGFRSFKISHYLLLCLRVGGK